MNRLAAALLSVLLAPFAVVAGSSASEPAPSAASADRPLVARTVAPPDHVVVVVFENAPRAEVLARAPYFAALAARGSNLRSSYAVAHPSQPNYLALYAGSTMGLTDDSCPHTFRGRHLGSQLAHAGYTFRAFSESLPARGSTTCSSADRLYQRKHAPWVNFSSFKQRSHRPFTKFPSDYSRLPTVSYVVPNMCHDGHDCSVATADSWLRTRLGPYADWAERNNSLLVVTFDEDDHSAGNNIYTVAVGARVRQGAPKRTVTHYDVLRTLEDLYGLRPLRHARTATAIAPFWG